MEQAMAEALRAVIQPNQCNLCEVKLADSNVAKVHYSSKRHKENLLLFENVVKKTINNKQNKAQNTLQTVPMKAPLVSNVNFPSQSQAVTKKRQETDVQKGHEDLYCEVCNIQTTSKQQMWKHLKSVSHQTKLKQLGLNQINGQYSPFCLNLPSQLKELMLCDICNICGDTFPTLKRALGHYLSPKHEAAVRQWFKVQRQPKKTPDETKACVCYICNISLDSKAEKDQHVQTFPHSDLSKLKSELVKKGIIKQFWLLEGSAVICALCNVRLLNSSTLASHIHSYTHFNKCEAWFLNLRIKKVPPETKTKWYYCKVCDISLDGTSESERHYLAPSHISKSELYCPICKTRVGSPEALKLHNTSAPHLINLKLGKQQGTKGTAKKISVLCQGNSKYKTVPVLDNGKEANKTEDVLNPALLPTESSGYIPGIRDVEASEHANTIKDAKNLKEKVFNELEKLIQKLYYSKQVPYEVSLKYLKQVNQEVDELSKKYQNKDPQKIVAAQDEGAASSPHNINNEGPFLAERLVSFYSDDTLADDKTDDSEKCYGKTDYLETIPGETRDLGKIEPIIADSNIAGPLAGGSNISVNYEMINKKVVTDEQKTDNSTLVPENSDSASSIRRNKNVTIEVKTDEEEGPKTISELLENIVKRYEEVEWEFPEEPLVEKQVLREITVLLKQVMVGGMPLQQILECLINFNERLEENIDIPDQQKEEKLDLVGPELEEQQDDDHSTSSSQQPVKTSYSKELADWKPDSKENLLDLKTEKESQHDNRNPISFTKKKLGVAYLKEKVLRIRSDRKRNVMKSIEVDDKAISTTQQKDPKEDLLELETEREDNASQNEAEITYLKELPGSDQKEKLMESDAKLEGQQGDNEQELTDTKEEYEAPQNDCNSISRNQHFTYSKEELLKLRPDRKEELIEFPQQQQQCESNSIACGQPIRENTYSKEELLKLRTKDAISPQLAIKLKSMQIWQGHFDKDELTAAEGCPTSAYNYYVSNNNFIQFMDFWEVYLQVY